MNPGRSINEAAQRLAEAEDWRLTEVAIHDPDMIRDVARAMLAAAPVLEIVKEPEPGEVIAQTATTVDLGRATNTASSLATSIDTRAKALEEAAKECERLAGSFAVYDDRKEAIMLEKKTCRECAAAIRAAITGK